MLLNFILFQIIWFGCIFLGDVFVPIALIICLFHLLKTSSFETDITLMLGCGVLGLIIDSALIQAGVLSFENSTISHNLLGPYLIPSWLVFIWIAFGMTMNHSMAYFQTKPLLALAGGCIGAPLSYLAGARLGAVDVPLGYWQTFLVFSVIWGPLFVALTQWTKIENKKKQHFFKVDNV